MGNMLFTCNYMRTGHHHLYDEVESAEQKALQNTFKTKHTRIEASQGTLSKQKAFAESSEEDIRDEDFDIE